MSLSNAQAVAILLMKKRKRRVLRRQITIGPMFFDDFGDLSAFTLTEDRRDLTAANAFEDWN
jgi:hypothetical protein